MPRTIGRLECMVDTFATPPRRHGRSMLTAAQVAENYFLESRHMLLEVAAHFDRFDAAAARDTAPGGDGRPPSAAGRAKMARLREAIAILAADADGHERTVKLLELFAQE